MNEPTFAEMFAGIGGFRLGLERSGWKCLWANEWDKYASQIYRKNFGEKELQQGDVRDINTDKIPEIDLLCGGFPCQSFSIAGKRKGTEEARGTLFAQIVRVASAKRPKVLLLENVKGLLSSDDGRDFAKILRVLGNLGYILQWQVINSKRFIPQNRERVFIIGTLGERSFRQIFPIRENGEYATEGTVKRQVCPTITSRYFKQGHSDPYILQQHSHSGADGKGRGIRMFEGVCPTLATQMGTGGNNVPMVMPVLTPDRLEKRQNGRRFKEPGEEMFTLTAQDKHGIAIAHCLNTEDSRKFKLSPSSQQKDNLVTENYRIRRLTPIECERLQGFPDGWTEGVSDTQRYKCLGNAVTVNVIQFLGERLLSSFGGKVTTVNP